MYDSVLLELLVLRCEEFTVPTQADYDPDVHLSLTDIVLNDKVNPSVTIKQLKTDPGC